MASRLARAADLPPQDTGGDAKIPGSVLITGAAGFIGSHLAEGCLKLGWRVIALDSFTGYYPRAIKQANLASAAENPACTVIEGDLLELDLRSLLERVDVVFHLAAQPGVRASWSEFDLYTRLNVEATQRLLHAAAGTTLERFVIASSSSVYGDAEAMPTSEEVAPRPVSPYGITKLAAEHLARVYWGSFGVPAVCLRYFTVYGPRQRPDMAFNRMIASALADRPFEVYGDGEQTRDFTFVADAVEGTVAAAQHGTSGASYNIGGGSRRSLNSVFAMLESVLGRRVERRYRERQLGDARDTAADVRLAARDLGFSPTRDFTGGLLAQVDWQREQLVTEAAEKHVD